MSELLSSASSWVIGDRGRTLAASSSGRGSSMATGATLLEVGLPFGPSVRVGLGRGGAAPVHFMGGGPRTFPGGVSKWQWKRMQLKKSRQIEKARLLREKHIYEARRRAELQAASPVLEMPWQKLSRVRPPNYITADEQITKLASRFQRRGGEDLWTEKDGPERFEVMENHMPVQFSDTKALNQKTSPFNPQQQAPSNEAEPWNSVHDAEPTPHLFSLGDRPSMRSNPSHSDSSNPWMSRRNESDEQWVSMQDARSSSYSQHMPRIRPGTTRHPDSFFRGNPRRMQS